MKKLLLSLASVPLFAGFAVANAAEPTPSEDPNLEPITLDAATLDGITAAGTNDDGKDRECCDDGDFNIVTVTVVTNVNIAGQQYN